MDGLTRILTKCAGGGDPQAQALQTAAQMAKGPAGVALPTIPDKPEEPVVDDKALQAANKEVDSKKKEIDNLRHQLQEAKLDVLKVQMKSDLADQQTKMRESLQKEQAQMFEKLRQEQKELDKRQLEFKMEEARHKSDMAAAESAHQAKLDKNIAAHDVQIAENKAKSLIDLANQSAKQYSSMMEQARKHSDAYFADKSKQYEASHPAIGPALQSRIDASLNAISRLGNPQTKIASTVDPDLERVLEARGNYLWDNENVRYIDPGTDDMSNTLKPLREYLLSDLPDDSLAVSDYAMRQSIIRRLIKDVKSGISVRNMGGTLAEAIQRSGDYNAASALRTLMDIANPDDDNETEMAAHSKHYNNVIDELSAWDRELGLKVHMYGNKNAERMKGPDAADAERARVAQATHDARAYRAKDGGGIIGNFMQDYFTLGKGNHTYRKTYPSFYDRLEGNDFGKYDENGKPVSSYVPFYANKWYGAFLDPFSLYNSASKWIENDDRIDKMQQLGLGNIRQKSAWDKTLVNRPSVFGVQTGPDTPLSAADRQILKTWVEATNGQVTTDAYRRDRNLAFGQSLVDAGLFFAAPGAGKGASIGYKTLSKLGLPENVARKIGGIVGGFTGSAVGASGINVGYNFGAEFIRELLENRKDYNAGAEQAAEQSTRPFRVPAWTSNTPYENRQNSNRVPARTPYRQPYTSSYEQSQTSNRVSARTPYRQPYTSSYEQRPTSGVAQNNRSSGYGSYNRASDSRIYNRYAAANSASLGYKPYRGSNTSSTWLTGRTKTAAVGGSSSNGGYDNLLGRGTAHHLQHYSGYINPSYVRSAGDNLRAQLQNAHPLLGIAAGLIPQDWITSNVPTQLNKYPKWNPENIASQHVNSFRTIHDYASPISEQLTRQYSRQHGHLT